jgi:hypothetical protein
MVHTIVPFCIYVIKIIQVQIYKGMMNLAMADHGFEINKIGKRYTKAPRYFA